MENKFLLQKENIVISVIGIVVMILGFILLSGGGSEDRTIFNPDIFNFRRLFVAPFLIVISFIIQVYAILYNPKPKNNS